MNKYLLTLIGTALLLFFGFHLQAENSNKVRSAKSFSEITNIC
jgi:hypothetical protein